MFSNDSQTSECSNRGRCNRENGLCECLEGYSGDSCEMHNCPSSGGIVCSGKGICVSEYEYQTEHMKSCTSNINSIKCNDLSIKEEDKPYLKRNNMCICESGYSGHDCSIKDCPYGLAGEADKKKNYYDGDGNFDITAIPPNNGIVSYDIVKIIIQNQNIDLEIVRCDKEISNEQDCRYEKIKLSGNEEKDGIRTKLKVYFFIYVYIRKVVL